MTFRLIGSISLLGLVVVGTRELTAQARRSLARASSPGRLKWFR
jgi:hypothetical protein